MTFWRKMRQTATISPRRSTSPFLWSEKTLRRPVPSSIVWARNWALTCLAWMLWCGIPTWWSVCGCSMTSSVPMTRTFSLTSTASLTGVMTSGTPLPRTAWLSIKTTMRLEIRWAVSCSSGIMPVSLRMRWLRSWATYPRTWWSPSTFCPFPPMKWWRRSSGGSWPLNRT